MHDIDQGVSTVDEPTLIGRTWHFSDGTTLPLVSGGDGPEGAEGEGDEGGDGGQGSEDSFSDDSLGGSFLQRVPEDHRSLLEPYVKQWDAGVTRRFQDIHSRYEPYKQFIEQNIAPDQILDGIQLFNLIENNPQYVYEQLAKALGSEQGSGEQPPQGNSDESLQGLPPELAAQIQRQQTALEGLTKFIMQQQEQAKIEAENQALDNYLAQMHEEYGDFNEDFVVAQIARGVDPDKAVKSWMDAVQAAVEARDKQGNGAGAFAPPVLGGGGRALPLNGTDVKKASSKDVTDMVSNILAQANKARG
jgi:hypothetical protein